MILEKSGDGRRAGPSPPPRGFSFSRGWPTVREAAALVVVGRSSGGRPRWATAFGVGRGVSVFGVFFRDASRGQCQAGSLTGAVHLSKDNAGVLRPAQRGQKPRVEQKGKSWLDPDFQYEYRP